jgi:2-polyprenyl-3-methyl-5-hydroxy-6-metoxy-1,4-benzoquinol methylase
MHWRWRLAQFLERLWWRWYLSGKDPASYRKWKTAYWRDFLNRTDLEIGEGAMVLDAGCGPAGIFLALDHCSVTAVDPLVHYYARHLPHFKTSDYPKVNFMETRLEELTFSSLFDIVFCLNAINHVDDIGQATDRLLRALKPGARLALSVDAHRCAFLKQIFQWFPGDALHPHQLDIRDYANLLKNRGALVETPRLLKRTLIFDYYLLIAIAPA